MELTSIIFRPRQCQITVRFRHQLYTSQLEHLSEHLIEMLPDLLEHRCHNRHGLAFKEELADTELGHAFEHVILAMLQRQGIYTKGLTTWNWNRDPLGTYRITIECGRKVATKQSILLALTIFTNALHGGPLLPLHVPPTQPRPVHPKLRLGRQAGPQLAFALQEA